MYNVCGFTAVNYSAFHILDLPFDVEIAYVRVDKFWTQKSQDKKEVLERMYEVYVSLNASNWEELMMPPV
jgi:hypothetical protein